MLIYNYKVTFLPPGFEVFELMQDLMSYFSIPVRGGDNPEGLSDITG